MPIKDIQSIKQQYGIIGGSDKLNHAINVALQVAPLDLSVLILGESGVGKDVFSRLIHDNSLRKGKKFFAINCGAIPEGTIDSELFGHIKGSFTNAYSDRKGFFEEANGGTIFLDEIGEMPLSTQARLLRVLEAGEFIRVGSSTVQKTNVRIVAATNMNLQQAIRENRFREDLYYRLAVVPIHIPALRERREDIPRLFRKFANEFAEKWHIPKVTLTEDANGLLSSCYWQGNIRQLKNFAEQISVVCEEREIDGATIRQYLPDEGNMTLPSAPIHTAQGTTAGGMDYEKELLVKVIYDMRKEINDIKEVIKTLSKGTSISVNAQDMEFPAQKNERRPDITDVEEYVDEKISMPSIERESIIKALRKHNNNRRKAAEELGISSRTIYRKISQYDIEI